MAESIEELLKRNYAFVRKLPDGTWIGLQQMLHTVGLMVGLDETGYRFRYCYDNWANAIVDFYNWDGKLNPPGPWIVRKGLGHDLWNPQHPKYDKDAT